MKKYDSLLHFPNVQGIKKAHIGGLFFGYSQFIRFAIIAFIFYMAAVLILDLNQDTQNTYIAVYIVFMAAMGTGLTIAGAPSISKAKMAATKIFEIIDEPSKIDTRLKDGIKTIETGLI